MGLRAITTTPPTRAGVQPRFFGFGDSITSDGGRIINAAAAPDVNVYRYSWHRYAEYATQGRFKWGGCFGLSGLTINQLKTTYLPYVLGYCVPGDHILILMGQNSIGSLSAQDLTDYTTTVTAMLTAGLKPVLCTLTPDSTAQVFHTLNSHIRLTAAVYSLPLIDFTAALMDPTTGVYQASLTRDGVHPSEAGAVAMGSATATVLNSLVPNAANAVWLADCDVGYGSSRATTGGSTVPTFQTTSGSPALGTNWSIQSGSYVGATAYAAANKGQSCTFTASATQLIARHSMSTALPGDKFRAAFYLTATVAASSANWGFAFMDGAGVALYDSGRNNAHRPVVDLARSLFYVDFTHTGTNGLLFDIILTGSGGTMKLEQFTVLNLTAMGVA